MYADGLPILLAYQTAWNNDAADVAVIEKSRRIGLSWGDANERIIYVSSDDTQGDVYYQSYNHDMTAGYMRDAHRWAARLNTAVSDVLEDEVIVDDGHAEKRFTIDCPSGNYIQALASGPHLFRSKGRPGDIALIDEAAFVVDLDASLTAAMAFLMWGGRVRVMSTHDGEDNPFCDLVNQIKSGRRHYALHTVTLDDALDAGFFQRICSVKGQTWTPDKQAEWRHNLIASYDTEDDAMQELFCVPLSGSSVYFSRALIESRMSNRYPVVRFTGTDEFNAYPEPTRERIMDDWRREQLLPLLDNLVPEQRHVFGMDFGRSVDLSILAPLAIAPALRRVCPFLVELSNVPHRQQSGTVRFICDRLPRFSGACIDARGNGSFVAEDTVDAYGSIVEQVMITEEWWRTVMPRYKALYEDDKIVIPACDAIVQDHRAVRKVRGVPKIVERTANSQGAGKRHGDSVVGLAMATMAAAADTGPFEVHGDSDPTLVETLDDRFVGQAGGWYGRAA